MSKTEDMTAKNKMLCGCGGQHDAFAAAFRGHKAWMNSHDCAIWRIATVTLELELIKADFIRSEVLQGASEEMGQLRFHTLLMSIAADIEPVMEPKFLCTEIENAAKEMGLAPR